MSILDIGVRVNVIFLEFAKVLGYYNVAGGKAIDKNYINVIIWADCLTTKSCECVDIVVLFFELNSNLSTLY